MAPEWPSLLQRSKCSQSEQPCEGRGQFKGRIGLERPTGGLLERHRLGQRRHESDLACTQADERRIIWPSQYKEIGSARIQIDCLARGTGLRGPKMRSGDSAS
jgi:hypothetical protein